MSARDVDEAFERAYQRLFRNSTATAAATSAESSSSRAALDAGASQPSQRASDPSREALPASSSTSRSQGRSSSADNVLPQQPSTSKVKLSSNRTRPSSTEAAQSGIVQRPASAHTGLQAFAQQYAPATSKGKARAQPHLAPDKARVKKSSRSPSTPVAPQQYQQSTSQGAVAYYQYPHGQASYPIVTSMPGQAVTWTQPIVAAGPVPGLAYPGFSASVTFSQPQFFASPPQPIQPAITHMPSSSVHHYDPQHSAASSSESRHQEHFSTVQLSPHRKKQQKRASTSALPFRQTSKAYQAGTSPSKHRISEPLYDGERLQKKTGRAPSKRFLNGVTPSPLYESLKRQVEVQWLMKPKTNKPKKALDEYGRIVRQRGRPPKRSVSADVERKKADKAEEKERGPQVKAEPAGSQASLPPSVQVPATEIDGILPLEDNDGPARARETRTLFVHQTRRLRWLAKLAVTKRTPSSDANPSASLANATDALSWAQWSNCFVTRPQPSSNPAVAPAILPSSPSKTQPDPVGLFPRAQRQVYIALRKSLHTTTHKPTSRVCIHRLTRYLCKVSAAATLIDSLRQREKYLERKHRPAKLARYMFRSKKPALIDGSRLWSVWARTAHAKKEKQRKVAFAPPAPEIKQEPKSPSLSGSMPMVKIEPGLEEELTLGGVDATATGVNEEGRTLVRNKSPLFLRRNFRVYRLVGISDLPRL